MSGQLAFPLIPSFSLSVDLSVNININPSRPFLFPISSPSISYCLNETLIMTSFAPREYDVILLGATGYTGKLCAEHITTNLPTDLKWAVAGRSSSKLSALVDELRALVPDRLQPGLPLCRHCQMLGLT